MAQSSCGPNLGLDVPAHERRCLRRMLSLALVSVLGLAGCSGGASSTTFPVKGRVLLGNGKPLNKGRVVFISKESVAPPASGDIQSDGTFRLSTRRPDDGAVPGDYRVRVEPADPIDPKSVRLAGRKLAYPLKYIDEDSSGVVRTVRAEANELEPIVLN